MSAPSWTKDAPAVSVEVRGQRFDGWLQSEVTRDLESIAGSASIAVALDPAQPPAIQRQDLATVRVGKTVVLTGYVLAAAPFYRRGDCGMRVSVRDRTGDLVHCSAIHGGGHWRNASLQRVVADLVGPFGLAVEVTAGVDIGAPLADFRLQIGETVLDAVSRAARLRGVLVSRSDSGTLLLTKAGATRFAGAIVRGMNVISAEDIGTDDRRHSEYRVYAQGSVAAGFEAARTNKAVAKDAEMARYLPLIVPCDGNTTPADLQALVDHTARVRRGHSMGLRYVVEGWTWAGQAWPLNARVAVWDDVMGLAGQEWLITRVRQTCDLQEGDVTELVLRPVEAYDTVPLKTKPKHRAWGNKGNRVNHQRGPSDGAAS